MAFCPPSPRFSVISDGARALSAHLVRQHAAVFIIRMRGDHHQAGAGLQSAQPAVEAGRSAVHPHRQGIR